VPVVERNPRGARLNMENNARMEHAELVSKVPAATQEFLEKAFGLKFTEMGAEMGNYRMHGRDQGVPNNAIGIREPMGPENPGTISYLTVPNIDAALTAVKVAGGKIVLEKTEVPKVGFTAITLAPGEVTLGLFQYTAAPPKK
jgi:predicted enzyme related to lactoylglutathione lyase